jgi:hypothetical protein
MAEEMIAMQLNGAFVGRTVNFEYRKTSQKHPGSAGKLNNSAPRKIVTIRHWPNGDVSISQGSYYKEPDRYPFDAKVIFHD